MSNPQIVKSDKFSCSNVDYSDPKKLQHGGQAVYLNYDGKPLILQTPKMSMPWGMGKFDGDIPKYSVDLSFKGMDNSESLQAFYSALNKLDEKLVEDGVSNSMQWFKKKKQTKEVCKALYAPQIKVSKDKNGEPDGKYPPTMKVKVPWKDGKFDCDAYDSKRQLIQDDLSNILVKGSQVQALIQCVGIWFAGGKYGCSWKVVQMKVTPPAGIHGYSFIDDSEDEDEAEDEVAEGGSDEDVVDEEDLVSDEDD
jgi:hypothetical protein